MVYLAIEPSAVAEAIELTRQNGAALWLGVDAIGPEEHARLCKSGLNITRFTYPLSGASEATLSQSIATVAQHHPGETLWVQSVARP